MKYQDLQKAKEILNLPDHATRSEIKTIYRSLMNRWHPDKSTDNREECEEMSKQITTAYQLVMKYCDNYRYAFTEPEFKKHLSGEEWWMDRFGNDPLWGA